MYSYEIELCGVRVRHSKVCPKELTEEEKAEIEAAKGTKGKAPPPKGKVEEIKPSAEELERLERAKLEREEEEKARQAEWDSLDEETKFHRTNEDSFKEPCIRMQNLAAQYKLEKL